MLTTEQASKTAQQIFLLDSFEDTEISTIVDILKTADEMYFNNGDSFLEDNQYDALKQYAHGTDPTNAYFIGVGSSIRGSKIKLPYPMGSLTQAYQGDVSNWIAKYNLQHEKVIITDKLDGVSVMIVYDTDGQLQIAFSRGDGTEGADITRHISKIPSLPKNVKQQIVLRAEVIASEANFLRIVDNETVVSRSGKPYKNARNMVAGLLNAETNPQEVYKHLNVVAYEVIVPTGLSKQQQITLLEKNKFETAISEPHIGNDLNDHFLTTYLNNRRTYARYAIDGIVLDVDDAILRSKINPSKDTLNPEYARKFKVADESNDAVAIVKEVQWNVSKDGFFKPRVKIEPIELVGVTIQHATGFNGKFIADNGIGPGAKVKITRSGDVIPYIYGVAEKATPQLPPGDWTWNETGVDIIVANKDDHADVKFEQLLDFFNTIDVDNLGEGNLKQIFDAGFETPESVIELTVQDVQSLVGSRPIGKKIFDALHKKLQSIPEYVLMGAHPCFGRGIGTRKMKKLWEAFEGDMSECANIVRVLTVEGFEQKTAQKVANGYPKYVDFVNKINKFVSFVPYEAPKQGHLTGQTIVFTGFRDKQLEQSITNAGGKIGTSVSGKTTILITADADSQSGKATKARELGIRVLGRDQFIQEFSI